MISEWISAERHRLQIVKEWPNSPYREATLSAIHSALMSLGQDLHTSNSPESGVGITVPNGLRVVPAAASVRALAA